MRIIDMNKFTLMALRVFENHFVPTKSNDNFFSRIYESIELSDINLIYQNEIMKLSTNKKPLFGNSFLMSK